MSYGSAQEIGKEVADPKSWMTNLKETVVIFSDQVPFYVATGHTASFVAPFEHGRTGQKINPQLKRSFYHFRNQALKQRVHKGSKIISQGCNQKRSYVNKDMGKTRVCLEVGVAVHHIFKQDGTPPVAEHLEPLLVLKGSPIRLDWVGKDTGKYIKEHCFYDGDFLQWRSKGEVCKSLKGFFRRSQRAS